MSKSCDTLLQNLEPPFLFLKVSVPMPKYRWIPTNKHWSIE